MTGTMEELLAAACVWLVSHWGLAAGPVRTSIVDAIGENGFRAVYSLIAIAVLVWVGFAFAAAPPGPLLWSFGIGASHIAAAMMVVPFLFIVAGLLDAVTMIGVGVALFFTFANPFLGPVQDALQTGLGG